MNKKDTRSRSITKAVTWRIISTLMTMIIVYLVSGQLCLAINVGLIDIFIKLTFYYIHERLWNTIVWGRKK